MSKVDLRKESDKRLKNKLGRKYKRDSKLQELERQLQFAETRCGTLKQQLDYIKLLYGCGNVRNSDNFKPSKEEGHGDGSNVNPVNYKQISHWNNQNGNLGTREDGDCPNFITKSASHSNTSSTNSSSKQIRLKRNKEKVEELKKKGNLKQKTNLKLLKMKKKSCKKVKKRRKVEEVHSFKVSNVSSQTQTQTIKDPVVEIYKNSALNVESESGFEIFCKGKIKHPSEVMGEVKNQKNSERCSYIKDSEGSTSEKAVSQEEVQLKSYNFLNAKQGMSCLKEEGIQTEVLEEVNQVIPQQRNDFGDIVNKENALKAESVSTEPLKSYCQPTISSKKKQVERDVISNLMNINVRNIPFIAARSTAPSHNIGVNIQQVLSIMKKRQPMTEPPSNSTETGGQENYLLALINSKKLGSKLNISRPISAAATVTTEISESKKRPEAPRSNMSYWRSSNSEVNKDKLVNTNEKVASEDENQDWTLKVDKLKKVLIFLHEDFRSLSHKYRRLQKKLTKRNITKTDAKDELAVIERDLEKKEEEITVVIALYKEVLNLREDVKKLQEKYNLVACGRTLMLDGLRRSNSTHTQMTALLRKIQNFQDQLKG